MAGSAELSARYQEVMGRIAQACRDAGRDPGEVTTVVVTKFHPVATISSLLALGHRDFGESRHQEAVLKAEELQGENLVWHFIGQLQSNKAKAVAQYADVIHSVDRPSLVDKLADIPRTVDVFLEVNLTNDVGRGGVAPGDLLALADRVAACAPLRLRGLMAVAPQEEEPARAFERVLHYREGLLALHPDATDLSLGMSQDYLEAIAVGATHLRIGTAITGKRPPAV